MENSQIIRSLLNEFYDRTNHFFELCSMQETEIMSHGANKLLVAPERLPELYRNLFFHFDQCRQSARALIHEISSQNSFTQFEISSIGTLVCQKLDSFLRELEPLGDTKSALSSGLDLYEISGSSGNPGDTGGIVSFQEQFCYIVQNHLPDARQLFSECCQLVYEWERKQRTFEISMACVYAPPEIMLHKEAAGRFEGSYPEIHKGKGILTGSEIARKEFIPKLDETPRSMGDVYGSPEIMAKPPARAFCQEPEQSTRSRSGQMPFTGAVYASPEMMERRSVPIVQQEPERSKKSLFSRLFRRN